MKLIGYPFQMGIYIAEMFLSLVSDKFLTLLTSFLLNKFTLPREFISLRGDLQILGFFLSTG